MRLIYAAFVLMLVVMTSAQCQQTAEDWAVQAYDKAIELNLNLAIGVITLIVTIFLVIYARGQLISQKKINKFQMFHMIMCRMESTREYRQILRNYIKETKTTRKISTLDEKDVLEAPESVRDSAEKICREFDIIGLLDQNDMIDSSLVDKLYSVPFVPLYDDFLHYYVEDLQRPDSRGPTHFWELAKFYERVKYVPRNHPALNNADDWPKKIRAEPKSLQKKL